jgi:hypothetical protein
MFSHLIIIQVSDFLKSTQLPTQTGSGGGSGSPVPSGMFLLIVLAEGDRPDRDSWT